MLIDIYTWLIVLGTLLAIVLLLSLKRVLKLRVRINSMPSKQHIGYLEMEDDGSGAEVLLPGGVSKTAIARVTVDDKSNRNHGYVDLITTDINEDNVKPHYKKCGYINFDRKDDDGSKHGLIYKQVNGKKGTELLGYTARPSAPNTPCLVGERNWKTLWMVCKLNAYAGTPNPQLDLEKNNNKTKGKESKATDSRESTVAKSNVKVNGLCINADAGASQGESSPKIETDEALSENIDTVTDFTAIASTDEKNVFASTEATEASDIQEDPNVSELDDKEESSVPTTGNTEETETQTELPIKKEDDSDSKDQEEDTKKGKKKLQVKEAGPTLLATCCYSGFHSLSSNPLPPEARACAYAVIQRQFSSRKYSEQYKNAVNSYGWKDTALLSSLIYSVLFLILYLVNTGIFQMPLLGNDIWSVSVLSCSYFAVWAIVRLVKIDCIENLNSFQPQLELFNKNLGLKWTNTFILVLCTVAFFFCKYYYDFDFIPLIFAISTGVGVNMGIKNANRQWIVRLSYVDSDSDEEDGEEGAVENPAGDISHLYEWDLDSNYCSNPVHGELTLYFSANTMKDVRHCNPFFLQRKDKSDKEYIMDMFNFLKDHKVFLARVRYIADYIDKVSEKNGFSPLDRIQFTLDFIQEPNIKFCENKDCLTINRYDDYIRFPDETLYDQEGDCNSKSLLASMLFHVMGYDVLYLISRKHQHSAIGIQIKRSDIDRGLYCAPSRIDDLCIRHEGKFYIFCETTSDGCAIGKTMDGMSLEEFSEKIPLLQSEDEDIEPEETEQETRIYNWDLDSEHGNTLHGNLTIDFETDAIKLLRESNPFLEYGKNANTYEQNIRLIFDSLLEDPSRMDKVQIVADYIKKEIETAQYSELDKLQFALDFVQAPNITYCVDENSAGIEYAKEYMRYPDEVLFDKEGDCDCKSSLATAIFHALGYNVIVMLSQKLQHAAIGIECNDALVEEISINDRSSVVREYNGKQYIYCETTGDGFKIGHIKENDSIQDFETIVEIKA